MPVYEVGCGSCEDSVYYKFWHPDVLTDEQLKQHTWDAIVEVAKSELEEWPKSDLFGFDLGHFFYSIGFIPAMESLGFEFVHPARKYCLNCWARDEKNSFGDKEEQELFKYIKEKLKDCAEGTRALEYKKHSTKESLGE